MIFEQSLIHSRLGMPLATDLQATGPPEQALPLRTNYLVCASGKRPSMYPHQNTLDQLEGFLAIQQALLSYEVQL
ncbi:hypothetical protein D3C81_2166500 [compost metagenome]